MNNVTKSNCYYSKIEKNKGNLFQCGLISISPNCENCIYFIDSNDKEKMEKMEKSKKIIDLYKKRE